MTGIKHIDHSLIKHFGINKQICKYAHLHNSKKYRNFSFKHFGAFANLYLVSLDEGSIDILLS